MLLPDVILQPHVGDGYPVLVFKGERRELTEAEMMQFIQTCVARLRPTDIIVKTCACIEDE